MIERLRKRFIKIATIAVALVLLLLSLIVNVVNFISVDRDLTEKLTTIEENQGTMPTGKKQEEEPEPEIPETSVTERKEPEKKKRDFSLESSYSARYFVIRYTEEGELVRADLEHIASVTSEDVDEYVAVAQKKKEGFGYGKGFKYYVEKDGQGRCMVISGLSSGADIGVCRGRSVVAGDGSLCGFGVYSGGDIFPSGRGTGGTGLCQTKTVHYRCQS